MAVTVPVPLAHVLSPAQNLEEVRRFLRDKTAQISGFHALTGASAEQLASLGEGATPFKAPVRLADVRRLPPIDGVERGQSVCGMCRVCQCASVCVSVCAGCVAPLLC